MARITCNHKMGGIGDAGKATSAARGASWPSCHNWRGNCVYHISPLFSRLRKLFSFLGIVGGGASSTDLRLIRHSMLVRARHMETTAGGLK